MGLAQQRLHGVLLLESEVVRLLAERPIRRYSHAWVQVVIVLNPQQAIRGRDADDISVCHRESKAPPFAVLPLPNERHSACITSQCSKLLLNRV